MRGNARGGGKRGGGGGDGGDGGGFEVDEKGDAMMDMSDDY
jgi:hypothetical protein